ncbi:hypothetical protein [Paenarthrobacter nitroguajacolicus]|uniref:hypothetical protein n=1 Tax=Paenarthrobacter nitroguajacolicus TaxID=211146 RepID=UPI00248BA705|nr:hypothetical protein [Paenarthrobacter nitroguajacolicus]MDI2032990.1 hypothetical protein [Paenarthrobacter nitroguajacolicus]
MSKTPAHHGIDLFAPGGLTELFAFHRATFGDAVMEGDDGGDTDKGKDTTVAELLAEVDKWKSLARKNEDRAKENADKAKRFDALEEANKSDLDKEKARADAAEKALADRDTQDAVTKDRDDVAKEFGIDAALLRGASREELEDHAKALQPLFKKDNAPGSVGAGDAGSSVHDKEELSADDVVAAAVKR